MARIKKLLDESEDRLRQHETASLEGASDGQVLTLRSRTIRTMEGAIKEAKVDVAIWEVERWVVNKWDVAAKLKRAAGDTLAATELWQIKIWLRRKAPKPITDGLDLIYERMRKCALRPKSRSRSKPKGDLLYVLSLYDHHFGKMCWAQETGQNYDLKIAERIFENAVNDLLAYTAPLSVSRYLVPVGQDFLHIDNLRGETTKGTPQDVDGRYPKVFNTAYWAMVRMIDYLLDSNRAADVDVILSQGNHDQLASWHLTHSLTQYYRLNTRVKVCTRFKAHKYYPWGVNLLGLSHAENVPRKWDSLPNMMATEVPQEWAATTHHEWLIGHVHHRQKHETLPMQEHMGTIVRTLPSLSATDAWHYSKGYLSTRAAEAFLYSKSKGYVGSFSVNARD